MSDLFYYEDVIVDCLNGLVICTGTTKSWRFDFENMSFYLNNSRSQQRPIRFDAESNEILYWTSGTWHNFNPVINEAALKMFNYYCDRQILA